MVSVPLMDLAALIGDIANGGEKALTEFYDSTVDWVYGFVRRIVGDAAQAEEATQDVYFHVWKRASSYDPRRGSPSAWLCQVARSRALDRLRARRRQSQREAAVDWDLAGRQTDWSDPPDIADREERSERVHAALARLPEKQRRAIELAFFEGMSHAEVAARLEEPLGTVKTRIQLGMTKLRESLRPIGKEE
jgi:RNA polymerase sigma-70 factor (ECF subfamily)